ncbi:MAG: amidohydrolase family protein [Fusicatenibacter sp.]|nr:amidohydrolase family protein [Fusicatenibacter sp.]
MEQYLIRSKNIFTGLRDAPESAAIAVEGKSIRKVLPWDYTEETPYAQWPLYDYGEQLILPSFIDAHTHLFSGAINASDYVCDTLGQGKSQEECVEIIKKFADEHPDQKRIRGAGWFVGNWNDAPMPDKRSLDAAIPDRPVYLQCADAHSFWLNSAALLEAGIDPDLELENGVICKFDNGELSGLLLEPAACAPATEKYMEFSDEELREINRNFQKILASCGIAGASEMFADDYVPDTYRRYEILKKLDEEEGLCAQIYAYTKLFGYTDFTPYFEMKKHFTSEHFHIQGVKGFVDGVTETYTGLLLEPYEDRPWTCGDGLPLWPQEKMQEEIIAANRSGIQVRLHCIGDGSVRMALDMYENSRKVNGEQNLYNTVEHIENIHPLDIPRFAELNVIPSMQPYHLTLSNNDKIFRIGAARCQYEWPIRTILEHGGQIAIGTDYPVVTINPFVTLYAAVTRKDDEGIPTGHNPWEKLELNQAIRAYTLGAAKVYHADDKTGTLEEGKMANLIVLDTNLFTCREEEIPSTKICVNYFEGKKIYQQ